MKTKAKNVKSVKNVKPVKKKSAVKKTVNTKKTSVKNIKAAKNTVVKPVANKPKPISKKTAAKKTAAKIKEARDVKKPISVASEVIKASLDSRKPDRHAVNKNGSQAPIKKHKPNKKTKYTAKELQAFKDIILDERNKIIESAKANMESLVDDETGEYVGDDSTYASHMAEQGSDEMEREKNYMFVQRDEKYLGYLQEALVRIDQGTYGICLDCMENPKNYCKTCPLIPAERLELVPVTQHCIECKNLRG